MDSQKIQKFLNEIDSIERRASGNARSGMFARRAHDAITECYFERDGEYIVRVGKSTARADKLVNMGTTEAIYGRGRALLQR